MADQIIAPATDTAAPVDTAPAFIVDSPNGGVQVDPVAREAAQKEDATPKKEETKPERPEGLPEGFDSWEAAYKALSTKPPESKPEATPDAATKVEDLLSPESIAKAKGLDLTKLSAEVQRDGVLSAESLKTLEEKGIDAATAGTLLNGLKAQAQQIVRDIADSVGGPEQFQELLDWGQTGLSVAEREAFNVMLQGSVEGAKLAVAGLQARFTEVNGGSPRRVNGSLVSNAETGVKPFRDAAEMKAAMRDKRYNTSEAYRQTVAQRIGVSSNSLVHVSF